MRQEFAGAPRGRPEICATNCRSSPRVQQEREHARQGVARVQQSANTRAAAWRAFSRARSGEREHARRGVARVAGGRRSGRLPKNGRRPRGRGQGTCRRGPAAVVTSAGPTPPRSASATPRLALTPHSLQGFPGGRGFLGLGGWGRRGRRGDLGRELGRGRGGLLDHALARLGRGGIWTAGRTRALVVRAAIIHVDHPITIDVAGAPLHRGGLRTRAGGQDDQGEPAHGGSMHRDRVGGERSSTRTSWFRRVARSPGSQSGRAGALARGGSLRRDLIVPRVTSIGTGGVIS